MTFELKFASAVAPRVEIPRKTQKGPSGLVGRSLAASRGDSKKPMCRQGFLDCRALGKFANASSLYLAVAVTIAPSPLVSSASPSELQASKSAQRLATDALPVIVVGPHMIDTRTGHRRATSMQKKQP
jgi:hypothetical protein